MTSTAATAAMTIHFVLPVFCPVTGTILSANALIATAATLSAINTARTIATILVHNPLFIFYIPFLNAQKNFNACTELFTESRRTVFI